ncbi:ATP-binding cassette domain-containing protein [Poseidonibacter lekithochrous]|uniref:ATP-binding cassette domain-containing protein n=1 Tax=Poseidonibacter TaxID=2321187 RepID=UPI001C091148|nr:MULTISPECIES: ATP-binding cassette domain-containing protein [Poseidonibacter]MBU3013217.1 ATP-binding cassette domain-containing protein [Poseidonibacter lekithochrous]MDO6826514.1 ATP-binding cassette domain-containing protein [Poseidonibacter sp. 1_MG-2023]
MAFNLQEETISYGDFDVLIDFDLSIKKGEKVALLGKSGSGKSTLLKHLFDLQKENSTYIPQELGLVNNLSVFHNVYISKLDENSLFKNLRNLILPSKLYKDKILKVLEEVELEDKLHAKIANLSGGQKQRCAISRAIFDEKSILLADEPISALDEYLSDKTLKLLTQKFETSICALHNVDLAIKNFHRVIGLKNGKVLVDKACSDLTDDDRQKLYYVCD